MKNKRALINISLAVLLLLSIAGNFILFSQLSNSKLTLAELKTQLEKGSIQFQNTQSEWKTLQASIADAEKENVRLLALTDDGLEYGDGWIEVPAGQAPPDAYKVLSSGLTLWDAKLVIDGIIETVKEDKGTAEYTKLLDEACKELGTTMPEINSLPAEKPAPAAVVTKKATTAKTSTTSKPTVKKPTTTTVKKPTTTTTVNNADKNGNGIDDAFEGSQLNGTGTTTITGDGSGGLTAN
ncbi:hypothetical protein [Clostridium sp.]|uniref:hypothetical protein n=1 Tax=Clostridium sp. TaxID=1506 RepID=UPI001A43BF96|nr:hypothetical protein [Clostridium sp.]MBK5241115.1 hypothetical protein [Clostridium sp.]